MAERGGIKVIDWDDLDKTEMGKEIKATYQDLQRVDNLANEKADSCPGNLILGEKADFWFEPGTLKLQPDLGFSFQSFLKVLNLALTQKSCHEVYMFPYHEGWVVFFAIDCSHIKSKLLGLKKDICVSIVDDMFPNQ